MVLGTVGYMSPEQVRGKAADHRSDIFAFGAIVYEMLAGKRAFGKATSADTMTAILNEDPPAVSQIVPSTPPGLQRVVHRCVEKNPEQRFQSAADLAFALEAISESGISGPVSAASPVQRNSRRPLLWAAGMVAVLVMAAAAYFVILRRDQTLSLRISDYTSNTNSSAAAFARPLRIANSSVASGGIGRRTMAPALASAGARCRLVSVYPLRSDTDASLGAEWIAPVPGTDAALMLALSTSWTPRAWPIAASWTGTRWATRGSRAACAETPKGCRKPRRGRPP